MTSSSGLWRHSRPLILASKSAGRRYVLEQAGIPLMVDPARIDERAIESRIRGEGGGADAIAGRLAREKAATVSMQRADHYVLGADQMASCDEIILGKPADMESAERQLRFLAGKTHRLHSAVALARNGEILFSVVCHADLEMRSLGDEFVGAYLSIIGDLALDSVGAYQIEGLGVQLFERIDGDHSTIIGLPILPVLAALRREGAVLS